MLWLQCNSSSVVIIIIKIRLLVLKYINMNKYFHSDYKNIKNQKKIKCQSSYLILDAITRERKILNKERARERKKEISRRRND